MKRRDKKKVVRVLVALAFLLLLVGLFSGCKAAEQYQAKSCDSWVQDIQQHIEMNIQQNVEVTPPQEYCDCIAKARTEKKAIDCYQIWIHKFKVTPR